MLAGLEEMVMGVWPWI